MIVVRVLAQAVLGFCSMIGSLRAEPLTIRQLAVGEGTATLLSQNDVHILVDTGNPVTAFDLQRKLTDITGGKLKALIVTHPHQDHIGGVFTIAAALNVENFYDNGQSLLGKGEPYRWYHELVRQGSKIPYKQLRSGESVPIGVASLSILSPMSGDLNEDWNRNSLVIRVTHGTFCALLMGDALIATEADIVARYPEQLRCPVVQIGHHGSQFASSSELVKATRAGDALLSVNVGNIRGYPDAAALNRWREAGTRLHDTRSGSDVLIVAKEDGSYEITRVH